MKRLIKKTVAEISPTTNRLITLDGNMFLDACRLACIDDHQSSKDDDDRLIDLLYSLRDLLWVEPGDVESHLCNNNMNYIQKVEDIVFADEEE